MGKNHDIITIDVDIKHTTEKAYLVDKGKAGVWLAKSMCEYDHSDMTMQLPEWLALEKGLI